MLIWASKLESPIARRGPARNPGAPELWMACLGDADRSKIKMKIKIEKRIKRKS
jgi:hypothetical protein